MNIDENDNKMIDQYGNNIQLTAGFQTSTHGNINI